MIQHVVVAGDPSAVGRLRTPPGSRAAGGPVASRAPRSSAPALVRHLGRRRGLPARPAVLASGFGVARTTRWPWSTGPAPGRERTAPPGPRRARLVLLAGGSDRRVPEARWWLQLRRDRARCIGLRAFVDFSGVDPAVLAPGLTTPSRSSTASTTIGALCRSRWPAGHAGVRLAARWRATSSGELHASEGRLLTCRPGLRGAAVDWAGGKVWCLTARTPTGCGRSRPTTPGRDDLTSAEWDEVTHELVGQLPGHERASETPVRLPLSGGKDSRLLPRAEPRRPGSRTWWSLRTNGPADSPEVECAAGSPGVAGFPHERIVPTGCAAQTAPEAPVAPEPFPVRAVVDPPAPARLPVRGDRQPVGRPPGPIRRTTLNIRGIGGELYRRGNVKSGPPLATDEHRRSLARLYADVLRPARGAAPGAEASFQAGLAGVLVRGRGRSGALRPASGEVVRGPPAEPLERSAGAGDAPGTINVLPLLSGRRGVEEHGAVGGHPRSSDRLHFEVMRERHPSCSRCRSSTTCGLPPLPTARPSSPLPVPRAAGPDHEGARPTEVGLHRRGPGDRTAAAFFLWDAEPPHRLMGDLCNIRRLRAALEDRGPRGAEGKQIFSSIAVAIALLGRAEPALDVRPQFVPDESGS